MYVNIYTHTPEYVPLDTYLYTFISNCLRTCVCVCQIQLYIYIPAYLCTYVPRYLQICICTIGPYHMYTFSISAYYSYYFLCLICTMFDPKTLNPKPQQIRPRAAVRLAASSRRLLPKSGRQELRRSAGRQTCWKNLVLAWFRVFEAWFRFLGTACRL